MRRRETGDTLYLYILIFICHIFIISIWDYTVSAWLVRTELQVFERKRLRPNSRYYRSTTRNNWWNHKQPGHYSLPTVRASNKDLLNTKDTCTSSSMSFSTKVKNILMVKLELVAQSVKWIISLFWWGWWIRILRVINHLKAKRRLLYLRPSFVPSNKHFSSRL